MGANGSSDCARRRAPVSCVLSAVDLVQFGRDHSAERTPNWRWSADPLTRETEHPLGDDVALDLRRAARDGPGEAAEVVVEPAGVERVELQWRERPGQDRVVEGCRRQPLDAVEPRPLAGLGAEQ